MVQRGLQRERALGDERGESRSSANDDHLYLIAVIGGRDRLRDAGELHRGRDGTETCVRDCLVNEGESWENHKPAKPALLPNCAVVASFILCFTY